MAQLRRAATRVLLSATLVLVGLGCSGHLLSAQDETVEVVAGERYRAGSIHELLLGARYRALWTSVVRVPVLDPDTFAGGLTVLREGGGFSTRSLRMQGGDGRQYVFRSVDKDVSRGFGSEFNGTLAEWIVQDQVSAKHPAAALAVPPLLLAAGVLHVEPRLFVMRDHPFLGEHREAYAGLLGMVEERPDEGPESELGLAGADRIAGTDRLLEHLQRTPEHRVDSRAFLTARLMDLVLGDWDRHEDQWRWARFDSAGGHVWHPIPRDRDNAFVSHEGLAIAAARSAFRRLVHFRERYPDIFGLTIHATPLDRRLLNELPRAVWDSTVTALQASLTDAVIEDAVRRIPPEYRPDHGEEMARILRARRDRLPRAAREFYAQLSTHVDVHATDEPEAVVVERSNGGAVEVRIHHLNAETGARAPEPYFTRTFVPSETIEVRVHLQGGDDRAVVRGAVDRSLGVRIVGGDGDDVMVDSSHVRNGSGRTAFYDHEGNDVIVAAPATRVDRRPYVEPPDSSTLTGMPAYRDWGSEGSDFTPWAGWRSNVGVVIGGGPKVTWYGFRRHPYARRLSLRGLYAPSVGRFGLEMAGDFHAVGTSRSLELVARASSIEVTRFHGFGNETSGRGDDGRYLVRERQLLLGTSVHARPGKYVAFHAGPVVRFTDPRIPAGSPAADSRPRGSRAFGQLGGRGGFAADTRDAPGYPTRGFTLAAEGAGYPITWNDAGPFGTARATAAGYFTAPLPRAPTLALRLGTSRAWGEFPLQEASFLGGSSTVRGYAQQRYAGDGAAFGNAELRVPLFPINLGLRGDLGMLALADAGRVFTAGERSSAWHTAYGGGLWVRLRGGNQTLGATYARGDEHRLYLWSGFPF